jgi:hypothetical protein
MPSSKAERTSVSTREIDGRLDRAVGEHALRHLDDALIEQFGQDDLLGEDVGPRLVGDAQRVAETLGDQQQRAVALALQQRVGGDGGAHPHRADAVRRHRLALRHAEQVADALHCGVAIGFRVFRQQLVGMDRPGGSTPRTSVNVPPRSIQKSHRFR